MRESIHKYFQVGTLLWMSYPRTDALEAAKIIAKDDYFDALELSHIADDAKRAEIAKALSQSHLNVLYGAHPTLLSQGLNPNAVDEDAGLAAEKALLGCVDEAASMGATGIAFLAGKWSQETKEENYRQLLKTTDALCAYAKEKGLFVELEVFDYDIDKAALIGPAPLAAKFAADVCSRHNNFGLLIDLSHIPLTYEDPAFVVKVLRPYLTHFHIGSAVMTPGKAAYGDKHPRFGFPGGVNDTPEVLEFLRVLKEEGFFRARKPYILSFEVSPQPDEDPDIVLASCKRVLNRAWAMLED